MNSLPISFKLDSTVRTEKCAFADKKKVCVRIADELLEERWKSFSCTRSNYNITKLFVGLDVIYEHWQTLPDNLIYSTQHMVFKLPQLLSYLLDQLLNRFYFSGDSQKSTIEELKNYMPQEIFDAVCELVESDKKIRKSSLQLMELPEYWQGCTGADGQIFVQTVKKMIEDPFAFQNVDLVKYSWDKLPSGEVQVHRLSPGIYRAEQIRQQFVSFMSLLQEVDTY